MMLRWAESDRAMEITAAICYCVTATVLVLLIHPSGAIWIYVLGTFPIFSMIIPFFVATILIQRDTSRILKEMRDE